eukprot:TRINITY_DN66080_c6_g1_i1.p1 TRINITY_DN66080_c6_g1~~TRINITY_DN66080_c6_g1_i1.p1  ORF type:complete len:770 (-),score=406.31 TRINITY_DN66080_c6_g1_i1:151-2460(-)
MSSFRSHSPNLGEAVEIIKDRLYHINLRVVPKDTNDKHFFTIDNTLRYEPFYADFGPLNLGHLYRFSVLLNTKLNSPVLKNKRIYHVTSIREQNRANGAYLIGAWQVLFLNRTADEAWQPLSKCRPFIPFRDASMAVCTFRLTVQHCIDAVYKANALGWIDFDTFDVEMYEYYECVESGDLNILVPGKFLAFSGPHNTRVSLDGYPTLTPEDYVPIFKSFGVTTIIRLNKKMYDKSKFTRAGFKHYDMFFIDGTTPSPMILKRFLDVCEKEPGMIAVHCKAGLGRTGTTIACYMMKHYQLTAEEAIAWLRICRPGSVIGPQQHYLKQQELKMFKAGRLFRKQQQQLQQQRQQQEAAEAEQRRRMEEDDAKHAAQRQQQDDDDDGGDGNGDSTASRKGKQLRRKGKKKRQRPTSNLDNDTSATTAVLANLSNTSVARRKRATQAANRKLYGKGTDSSADDPVSVSIASNSSSSSSSMSASVSSSASGSRRPRSKDRQKKAKSIKARRAAASSTSSSSSVSRSGSRPSSKNSRTTSKARTGGALTRSATSPDRAGMRSRGGNAASSSSSMATPKSSSRGGSRKSGVSRTPTVSSTSSSRLNKSTTVTGSNSKNKRGASTREGTSTRSSTRRTRRMSLPANAEETLNVVLSSAVPSQGDHLMRIKQKQRSKHQKLKNKQHSPSDDKKTAALERGTPTSLKGAPAATFNNDTADDNSNGAATSASSSSSSATSASASASSSPGGVKTRSASRKSKRQSSSSSSSSSRPSSKKR